MHVFGHLASYSLPFSLTWLWSITAREAIQLWFPIPLLFLEKQLLWPRSHYFVSDRNILPHPVAGSLLASQICFFHQILIMIVSYLIPAACYSEDMSVFFPRCPTVKVEWMISKVLTWNGAGRGESDSRQGWVRKWFLRGSPWEGIWEWRRKLRLGERESKMRWQLDAIPACNKEMYQISGTDHAASWCLMLESQKLHLKTFPYQMWFLKLIFFKWQPLMSHHKLFSKLPLAWVNVIYDTKVQSPSGHGT